MPGPEYDVVREVPREVEDPQGVFDVAAAVDMILSIPQQAGLSADALYVLPGQGEWWREAAAIRDWEGFGCRAARLIIAGSYGNEATWEAPTLARYMKEPFNLTRTTNVILHDHAHHTAEQAAQMVTDVRTQGLSSIALYASPYHLPRAYMTFVAALYKFVGADLIPIIPVPTPMSPGTIVPETGMNARQLMPGELARIAQYQPRGDVASYDMLDEYLEWLWKQPILQEWRIH